MARKQSQWKNVYCLETDQWYRHKNRTSVEPMLLLLERFMKISYECRDVGTRAEFKYMLNKYFKRVYDTHPILYLAFHGWYAENDHPDAYINTGDGTTIYLSELENMIKSRCSDRVIHFGACGVMETHGTRLNAFVKETKALGILGYRDEVDWLEAAAFDALLIYYLQYATFRRKDSIAKALDDLVQAAPKLASRLGFRYVLKK